MLIVNSGDTVVLRDGRTMYVTDAVDQLAPEVIVNPDNIIVGHVAGNENRTIVTNMNEVVSIIE